METIQHNLTFQSNQNNLFLLEMIPIEHTVICFRDVQGLTKVTQKLPLHQKYKVFSLCTFVAPCIGLISTDLRITWK